MLTPVPGQRGRRVSELELQLSAGPLLAGLLAVRPDGQRRLYVVRPEGLEALRDFLAEFWPDSLQRLKQAVESGDGR